MKNILRCPLFLELKLTQMFTFTFVLMIVLGCYQIKMENTVSQFLVSTCRIQTKFHVNNNDLPLANYRWFGMSGTQTVCGSQAEFYIQPVNSCIDDIDILVTNGWRLAFDSSRF